MIFQLNTDKYEKNWLHCIRLCPPWRESIQVGIETFTIYNLCNPSRLNCGFSQASPPPQFRRAVVNLGRAPPGVAHSSDVLVGPGTITLGTVSVPSPDCVQRRGPYH